MEHKEQRLEISESEFKEIVSDAISESKETEIGWDGENETPYDYTDSNQVFSILKGYLTKKGIVWK